MKDKSFYVRLISNANLDIFPKNSLANFSNILPTTLNVPKADGWKVALHSVICSNEFVLNRKVKQLRVICDQLQPKYNFEKILSVHARNKYNPTRSRVHNFTPIHKEFYSLDTDEIEKLSIKIDSQFDEEKDSVKFLYGQPTIVTLIFKRFDPIETMSNPISIRVTNRINQTETKNANSFKIDLPAALSETIAKSDDYEIALASMTYEPRFPQLRKQETTKMEIGLRNRVNGIMYYKDYEFNLNTSFKTNLELVAKLNVFLEKSRDYFEGPVGKFFIVDMDYIKYQANGHSILKIPYQLALIMGSTDSPNADGRVQIEAKPNYQFTSPIKLAANYPNYMLLLTNFVRPSPLGNIFSPVLKTIPINLLAQFSMHQTYQSIDLEYHSLLYSNLDNLEFELYDHTGQLINFLSEKQDISYTLFIRKKKK